MKPQPSTVESPHPTQTGQHKGHTHSRQGGGYGSYGQGGIHQQGTSTPG